ncbi:MAG: D-alanyl-D-alanine carboxypeptidase family protein [bacterium]
MKRIWRKVRSLLILCLIVALLPGAWASERLTVAAKGAALIDGASGRVLFGQNENEMFPMASTTKVMTTLLALENAALDEEVTAGKNAAGVTGTSLYLSQGETLSMEHMLYGLMLRSGNDAAVAVAEHIAGSVPAFADMMNRRAAELNADAHFVNPHGLDADGHKISALGLTRVMREAMKNPQFRTITGTTRKVIPWVGNEYSRVLENKNKLLTTYEGATGGKTGFTNKAGRCLVFSAERDGLELIGAVLNCPTWFDTATVMLDYGFEHFRMENAYGAGETVRAVPVINGEAAAVNAVVEEPLRAAVPIGGSVDVAVTLPDSLDAPVHAGDILGTAAIKSGGDVVAQCNLVAAGDVEKVSLKQAFTRLFRNWFWWA